MVTNGDFEKKFTMSVIDASEDTIFVFNPQNGNAIIWNKAFKDISGYNDNEIKKLKAPDSYYSEEDLKKAKMALKKLLESGRFTLEMTLITKDGQKIPYEYSATTLQGPDGNMLIVSVGRNISERKEIERKLRDSEEKFRNITEQSLVGISVIQNGQFKYLNERVAEINGYPAEEIKNWAPNEFSKMIHSEDRKFVVEQARKKQAGETDIVNQYQFRIIKKNGDIIWLEIFSKTINYEGFPADLVMTIDITDKIKIEKRLRESEEKFRGLLETTSDWIWEVNQNAVYTYSNPQVEKILGYDVDEIIGKTAFDLMSNEEIDRVSKIFLKIKNEKNSFFGLINKNIHKDGHVVTLETSGVPFFDENGHLLGYRGIDRDITDKIDAEEKLKQSEERYRLIAENSDTVIWTTDMNLNINYVSSNSPTILGYTAEEAISLPLTKTLVPNSLKEVARIFREELRIERKKEKDLNRSRIFASEQIHKNGSIIPVEITFTFIRNRKGKAIGLLGTSRNISKRVKAEQKLRESEKRYQTLARVSPVGIFNGDANGNCLYVNERWIEIAGISFKYAMGEGWKKAIHPDDKERVFNDWYNAAKTKQKFAGEYRFMRPDGTVTWVIGQASPIQDELGGIQGYVGTITDINELKKAETKLKNSEENYREAYDKANFYKDLFTHDINNILQIINSSAELISYQLVDSEKSKYIGNLTDMIKKQIERGSKLISNVRTLSELEEEEVNINEIEVISFLDKSINFIKKAYSGRQIDIYFNNSKNPIIINANDLIEDVFENILINAIKYNENVEVEISIKTSKQIIDSRNYIKIEFIDNGIGVADHRKKIIFQSGHREQKGSKGMGLGLSLVSKILSIFNGKIWVEDRVKGDYTKGSNFIILLPLIK